jgi:hypothetical protein
MPIIPAFRRLRLKNHEFQDSLGYTLRPRLKKQGYFADSLYHAEEVLLCSLFAKDFYHE